MDDYHNYMNILITEILMSMNGTILGLKSGWNWIGRKLDVTDADYSIFSPLLLNLLPFVTLHLIVSQLLLKRYPQFVIIFSITLSFLWLHDTLGLRLSLVLFLQPLFMYCIFHIFKYAPLISVWIFFLSSLVACQSTFPLSISIRVYSYFDKIILS